MSIFEIVICILLSICAIPFLALGLVCIFSTVKTFKKDFTEVRAILLNFMEGER